MTFTRFFDQEEPNACADPVPDLLISDGVGMIGSPNQWWQTRRPRILDLFSQEVYGRTPSDPVDVEGEVLSEEESLTRRALRRQIRITLTVRGNSTSMNCLVHLPTANEGSPHPLFLGLNFYGNHTVTSEGGIPPSSQRKPGFASHRWSLATAIEAGYGVATIHYGDLATDCPTHWQTAAWRLFHTTNDRTPEQWGSIGIWAWGLSRALDYLQTDPSIDSRRVIVMGHSRLGKTALWAGAQDRRFAAVISNNSGCGGAALSRRRIGETVAKINTQFPHWFCENFHQYNDRESELPVDQHMLLSLIAPRPLYVASAEEDIWADPRGEFQSAKLAGAVYELLGRDGLASLDVPPLDQPDMLGRVGYHVRRGGHGITEYDWQQYVAFVRRHLG